MNIQQLRLCKMVHLLQCSPVAASARTWPVWATAVAGNTSNECISVGRMRARRICWLVDLKENVVASSRLLIWRSPQENSDKHQPSLRKIQLPVTSSWCYHHHHHHHHHQYEEHRYRYGHKRRIPQESCAMKPSAVF